MYKIYMSMYLLENIFGSLRILQDLKMANGL